MVVEEIKIKNATVKYNDASIKSREQSEENMQRAADIMLRHLNAKHNQVKPK
ncbi:MAG: hypothetical protein K0R92_554 [Lachnospiraceae bacterium]|jgi:hypothetical protein|nr:hypothetical protein [Lachnospiraceae bacterium]